MMQVKRDFFLSVLANERRLGAIQSVAFCPVPFDTDFAVDLTASDWPDRLSAAGFDPEKRSCGFADGVHLEALLPRLEHLWSTGSALAFDWPMADSYREPGQLDLLLSRHGFRLYEQRDLVDSLYWYQNLGLRPPRIPRRGTLCLAVRR